ncbi:uncharacterized protein LAJ45_10989 [Morchella importuna]|uniref:uncharacterized protein n=1 Tax=Morchella importuna TaxID=1174673 RepID=UPI001E8E9B03|nr:uncharacterized protein LAJ45_10989 [Morchella importuna]KAH8144969.1 hypothetical protein LAJ45_10989 [Morchella importuna]
MSETGTPVKTTQAPASADSPVVEKIITEAKETKEEVKEVKEESVPPQVTEIKAEEVTEAKAASIEEVKEVKETKEEVKVEGEKPKEATFEVCTDLLYGTEEKKKSQIDNVG